jgi:hypothetical protein
MGQILTFTFSGQRRPLAGGGRLWSHEDERLVAQAVPLTYLPRRSPHADCTLTSFTQAYALFYDAEVERARLALEHLIAQSLINAVVWPKRQNPRLQRVQLMGQHIA